MDKLLQLSNINEKQLQSYILRLVSKELNNLSEECYYPKLKGNYYDLLKMTGISENQIKKYGRDFMRKSKAGKAKLQVVLDPYTILNIFLCYYFILNNNIVGFSSSITLQALRQYSNLFYKTFKFCKKESYKTAMEKLSSNHLIKKFKGFSGFVYYLGKEVTRKYLKSYQIEDPEKISISVIELRTRISQSLKSFATLYYKSAEAGDLIKIPKEVEGEEGEKIELQKEEKYSKISNILTKKIIVYKYFDSKLIKKLCKELSISKSVGEGIAQKLNNVNLNNDINFIIKTFLGSLKDISQMCGKAFIVILKLLKQKKKSKELFKYKSKLLELAKKLSIKNENEITFLILYFTIIIHQLLCMN